MQLEIVLNGRDASYDVVQCDLIPIEEQKDVLQMQNLD